MKPAEGGRESRNPRTRVRQNLVWVVEVRTRLPNDVIHLLAAQVKGLGYKNEIIRENVGQFNLHLISGLVHYGFGD